MIMPATIWSIAGAGKGGGGGALSRPDAVILLHFDGGNGSSAYVDSGPSGLNVIDPSGAQSTGQVKFGASSLLLDATTLNNGLVYIDYTQGPEPSIGTGQFCMEFWVYPITLPSGTRYVIDTSAEFSAGLPEFYVGITSAGAIVSNAFASSANGVVTTGSWQHIAISRDGSNNLRIFHEGSIVVGPTVVTTSLKSDILAFGGRAEFGYFPPDLSPDLYLDEYCLSVGSAVYTAAFTPTAVGLTYP